MESLKKLREEKCYTQLQVAEMLGIQRPTYSRYESGERQPDHATLIKLSEIFNVSTDYLLGKTDFSAEENRMICQNITKLIETIKNPPNPEGIIGITQTFQQIQKKEYQFNYEALEQFSSYFGVSIDTLTSSSAPTPDKEASNIDVMIATESRDLSDKDKHEILYLIQYKKSQKATGKTMPFESSRVFTTANFDDDIERIAAFGGIEDDDEEPLTT